MKGLDLLFALRPLLWVPAVALYGAGAASAGGAAAAPRHLLGEGELWALLLLLGVVHLANGWRDREGDRRNRKGFPVAAGAAGERSLVVLGVAAAFGVVALGLGCSGRAQALLLGAGVLGAAYTIPPVELKRRAGLDLLAHIAGYGVIAFLLGAEGGDRPSGPGRVAEASIASIPYALGIGSVAVRTMLADRDGDAAANQRTLAVRLGPAGAARLAAALGWSTMAAGLAAGDWVPFLWGFAAGTTLSLGAAASEGGVPARAPIALQMLFLALLTPRTVEPLVFALSIGAGAAIYYRLRWGVGYPVSLGASEARASR